uniref:Uncharacterized protein n=1 Tax=Sus scrofa TaxID=9823 RepID=A0A4X1V5R7_PIG
MVPESYPKDVKLKTGPSPSARLLPKQPVSTLPFPPIWSPTSLLRPHRPGNKTKAVSVPLPTGRKPDVEPKLKDKFVEICQQYGIIKENIIDLTKIDRCFQLRGSGGVQESRANSEGEPCTVPT